jgi:CRP/FNR family transcriptional regulator
VIRREDAKRVSSVLGACLDAGDGAISDVLEHATLGSFLAGRDVMAIGDRVEAVPLIISGSIRVFWTGKSGREITLYRFGPGECCVLAADSVLGNREFPAQAQVVDDAEVALIPAKVFNDWLNRSPAWRALVFGAMSRRLLSLMETLDDVAFGRMDSRVAALLVQRAAGRPGVLPITHQEVADELGSAREVVSRILEDLRARGLVRLSRGTVDVVDITSLSLLATR